MTRPHILVAGIGNIFLGDDGFGCEVTKRLSERRLPAGVRVIDFGIRGFDLAYALMNGYDVTILVDATPRGGEPGTIYTIEPDLSALDDPYREQAIVETHAMDPVKVLGMVKAMGGEFKRILLVGCEPATFGPENEGQLGLSATVEASVEEAVRVIESLVTDILKRDHLDVML